MDPTIAAIIAALSARMDALESENKELRRQKAEEQTAKSEDLEAKVSAKVQLASDGKGKAEKVYEQRLQAAEAKVEKQEEKIKALKAKDEEQEEKIKALMARVAAMVRPASVPTLRFSERWRFLLVLGGLLSPALAVKAILEKPNDTLTAIKLAWSSYSFIVFSMICTIAAASANVRNIGNRSEKVAVILSGLLVGGGALLSGHFLAGDEDEDTAAAGKRMRGLGAIWAIIGPPLFYYTASSWSALSDKELSIALTSMFKGIPYPFGSILYLAVASTRCIFAADDEAPIYEQCGNPILPSYMVNLFLLLIWLVTFFYAPLMKEAKTKTWRQVMLLKMNKMEGLQFGLLGLLSTLAWMSFANTNEDGESMTGFISLLVTLVRVVFYLVLIVFVFDVIIQPCLCPSSAAAATTSSSSPDDNNPSTHDPTSTSTTSARNSYAFDMRSFTGLPGGP